MTDYMKAIREQIGPTGGVLGTWYDLPQGLKLLIQQERDSDRMPNFRYCYVNRKELTPEAEDEVRRVLELYNSPLIQALE